MSEGDGHSFLLIRAPSGTAARLVHPVSRYHRKKYLLKYRDKYNNSKVILTTLVPLD